LAQGFASGHDFSRAEKMLNLDGLQPLHMARPSRPSPPEYATSKTRTFFVTTRTFTGKPVFQTDWMAILFVDVLRKYTLAGKFAVREFVVMRNHVHLLITVNQHITIEKAVQMIKGGFSYRAKKELGCSGEIWQRGFSDVQVKDKQSYITHRAYIYQNPVKAGLVGSPEEYVYGSLYLRRQRSRG
jgi:putative transposase